MLDVDVRKINYLTKHTITKVTFDNFLWNPSNCWEMGFNDSGIKSEGGGWRYVRTHQNSPPLIGNDLSPSLNMNEC